MNRTQIHSTQINDMTTRWPAICLGIFLATLLTVGCNLRVGSDDDKNQGESAKNAAAPDSNSNSTSTKSNVAKSNDLPSNDSKSTETGPAESSSDANLTDASQPSGVASTNTVPFESFKKMATIQAGFSDLKALEFTSGGETFVTGGMIPKIWKLGSEEPIREFDELYPIGGTVVEADAMAITPDGKMIVMGDGEGTLMFVEAKGDSEPKKIEGAHPKGIISVSLSRDGGTLATSGYGGRVKIWNMQSLEPIAMFDTGEGLAVRAALTPDGKTVVAAGQDAVVWEAETGKAIGDLNLGEERAIRVNAVDLSPDSKLIATGEATVDFENAALLWSIETRKLVGTLKHEFGVMSVAFSPDGLLLATAGTDAKARIWSLADQKLLQTIEDDEFHSVDQIAWLPNSKALAVACEGTIRIWGQKGSVPTGETPADETADTALAETESNAKEADLAMDDDAAKDPSQKKTEAEKPTEAAPVKLPEAATYEDLARVFDLSKMERMKDPYVLREKGAYFLNYSAPGTVKAAREHHLKILEADGWKIDESVHETNDASYSTLAVVKDGFFITASFQAGSGDEQDKVYVTIENKGNIDPRRIPRPSKMKWPGGDRSGDSYVALMEPAEFEEFIVKTMTDAGWKQGEDLEFTQNALKLQVQTNSFEKGEVMVNIYVEVKD